MFNFQKTVFFLTETFKKTLNMLILICAVRPMEGDWIKLLHQAFYQLQHV